MRGAIWVSWENTEKYKIFPVPVQKEATNIDKDGSERVVSISYKNIYLYCKDSQQLHYQNLLIILQKEFTKLHVKIVISSLNMTVSSIIW